MGGLSSCASVSFYEATVRDHTVSIPLSLVTRESLLIVRPADYEFDLAVGLDREGGFYALLLRCTHAKSAVTFDGAQFSCALHGSTFNSAGTVTRGPASLPLERLEVTSTEDSLLVRV